MRNAVLAQFGDKCRLIERLIGPTPRIPATGFVAAAVRHRPDDTRCTVNRPWLECRKRRHRDLAAQGRDVRIDTRCTRECLWPPLASRATAAAACGMENLAARTVGRFDAGQGQSTRMRIDLDGCDPVARVRTKALACSSSEASIIECAYWQQANIL